MVTFGITEVFLIVALLGGFYMAWNIGANDVANAFGTSVGSGSLTLKGAVLLAAVFEFSGAFLVGAPVASTISGGIVSVEAFRTAVPDPMLLGIGMMAAVLGASVWLNVATYFGQPVSTTHAIIGGVIGFATISAGPACVKWGTMGWIAASWVVSPLVGGVMAFAIYRWGIRRFILESRHPVYKALIGMPLAIGVLVGIVAFSIVYKGLPKLHLDLRLPWALAVAAAAGLVTCLLLAALLSKRRHRHGVRLADRYVVVERWFGLMQVATASYMAFAHGANDVANAVGPLATAVATFRDQVVTGKEVGVPTWLLAFGGVGIVIGLATYGYKVMEAIGRKITEITPTRGFSAQMATATTVLVFSKLGMPISTTFVIVGAVMGVGFARGFGAIDLKVIRRIFGSWVVTIPAAAIFSAVFYWILRAIYL